jgi:gamma-glutamyltranspeptidase/glutathione hydrolase
MASAAALKMLQSGGTAVDAAIAANAVLSVTAPDQCGLGGDLFALIYVPQSSKSPSQVLAVEAIGRAGSGANPDWLRNEGLKRIPRNSIHGVTVPGCVDGWLLMHRNFGRLRMDELVEDAYYYAKNGFAPAPRLVDHLREIRHIPAAARMLDQLDGKNQIIKRPGTARALEAIGALGRDGFYAGEFGAELILMGEGLFKAEDLAMPLASISKPLQSTLFESTLLTNRPPAAGFLALGALSMLARSRSRPKFGTAQWYLSLINAFRHTSWLRNHHYDGSDVADLISKAHAGNQGPSIDPGISAPDTTAICVADRAGYSCVIVQSNGHPFGSTLATPDSEIFLHDRGAVGFNLIPGDPNELRPKARPRHTLSPMMVTDPAGTPRLIAGTMGGDRQPMILGQILLSLLVDHEEPASALVAPRFGFIAPKHTDLKGFDSFDFQTEPGVAIEGHIDGEVLAKLREAIPDISVSEPFSPTHGVAHAIVFEDNCLALAPDPRARCASVIGM